MSKIAGGKYDKYFLVTSRINRRTRIAIVKGYMFVEFINELMNDDEMEVGHRALLIAMLCGGLRVSEGLMIRRNHFKTEIDKDNNLFVEVKVLKKRRLEKRTIMIHPAAKDFVQKYVDHKRFGPLFDYSPSTIWKVIKRHFKIKHLTTHSFRHSNLSFLLFEQGLSKEKVAALIHVSDKIVGTYAHLNEPKTWSEIYETKKPTEIKDEG